MCCALHGARGGDLDGVCRLLRRGGAVHDGPVSLPVHQPVERRVYDVSRDELHAGVHDMRRDYAALTSGGEACVFPGGDVVKKPT